MPGRVQRRGFTLVELVVLCAGALLIAAQLVPAVQSAREAARATSCRNNLRAIGAALHNYHQVYNCFPPGWVTRELDGHAAQGNGWMTVSLPYIDEARLFLDFDPDASQLDELRGPRREAAMKPIATFRCPSDTTPEFNLFRGGWPTSNYSGNYGHLPFPRWLAGHGTDFWPGGVKAVMTSDRRFKRRDDPLAPTGLFAVNSCVGIRDVIDGTSNTILVGERGVTSAAGIWPGVTAAVHENDQLTDGSHASRPQHGMRSYSSQHEGVNVLLVDGSVRELNADIGSSPNGDINQPLGVFQKLSARNDKQVVEF
jgi:type II secretory pathway pseudopilin PulG